MSSLRADLTAPVVFGVRCVEPGHRGHFNLVYATSPSENAMRSLASGIRCNEVVVSVDGGKAWSRAEP